jgi:hypothetical protein
VGSGVYAGVPARDWRPAPPAKAGSSWRLVVAILGHPPTAAKQRLLIDLLAAATATTSSLSSSSSPAPRPSARHRRG